MKPKALQVAVLGDVHGHLTLSYALLRRWELETHRTLDLILQVGDMGAFPPPYRFDKATKRFAEHDPDELGYTDFYEGGEDSTAIFGPEASPTKTVGAEMVFIKGNHEDFEYLHEVSSGSDEPVVVDHHQRIQYLPSGGRFTFTRRGISLRVAGLGGISNLGAKGFDPVSENYTGAEIKALRTGSENFDVLLTHEPPFGSAASLSSRYREAGSRDAAALIAALRPAYHFCGHYHEPGARLLSPEGTQSYILNAVNFLKPSRLNPGCVGVLSWASATENSFEVLNAPWMHQYTRSSYRALYQ